MTVNLLPHQQIALEKLSNGKVLVGGVGTGKTVTALVYFYTRVVGGTIGDFGSVQTPMDIYVFTTARKRDELDWQRWAAQLGINRERNASVAGIQLTVDSYNNIGNYKDVKDAFIILDEQRMVGNGSWVKAFLVLARSNRWIMLSATPGDRWEDYIPLFIANGFYKNRTQFKREHIVYNTFTKFPKVDHYVNVGKLVRLRNSILVEMPYQRHTTRHIHQLTVDYDKELFERVVKKRWHVYENRPLRDVSELFSVMRKVVNSDTSRLAKVRDLATTHPRLIVFYNFDYELEILRSLYEKCTIQTEEWNEQTQNLRPILAESQWSKSGHHTNETRQSQTSLTKITTENMVQGFQTSKSTCNPEDHYLSRKTKSGIDVEVAEWNGHKHDPLPTSERWIYLVQYVAGAEAWNCITTDTVIFWSLTYSYKIFEQAKGRIDRLDTPFCNLHYYILASNSAIDRAIFKSLREKKSFNEKSFGVNT